MNQLDQVASLARRDIGSAIWPGSVWSAVRDSVSRRTSAPGRVHYFGLKLSACVCVLGIALALLAFGLVESIPLTHSALQGTLSHFGVQPGNEGVSGLAGGTASSTRATLATSSRVRFVSLADAQRQVSFHITTPTSIPSGYALVGASAPHATEVEVAYYLRLPGSALDSDHAVAITEARDPAPNFRQNLPKTTTAAVMVNGHPALYARGTWQLGRQWEWDSQVDLETMVWQADGLTYMLQADGTGLDEPRIIQIAESIR